MISDVFLFFFMKLLFYAEGMTQFDIFQVFVENSLHTSHSAYVATGTESNGAKIDGF